MKRRSAPSAPPRRNAAAAHPPGEATQLVTIEKPTYGGSFLARAEGKAVFVPLTLPGEQVRVRIVEDKRAYAKAEPAEILTPSPDRIVPSCRHFGSCGGCDYQHASYEVQLRFKLAILRETLERGGVRPPDAIDVLTAVPWAYRNRIRLAFDAAGSPGYRGRRKHDVVPIAECPIAAPLLVRAALAAGEIVRLFPAPHRPAEISLFCDAQETALLAGLAAPHPATTSFNEFCSALAGRIPELKGAELITEGRAGQPPRTASRWGAASLGYRAAGSAFRVDHGAFFQVNRWLIDALVDRVTQGFAGSLAWDLFAGVGLFARRLASQFARVVAVESAPTAIAALAHNLEGTTASAVKAAAADFLRRDPRGERPGLIVVDPPRTGLDAETAAFLSRAVTPALTYVSCDPATLARDLRSLLAAGYRIHDLALADLFPQTFHIESIVRLVR